MKKKTSILLISIALVITLIITVVVIYRYTHQTELKSQQVLSQAVNATKQTAHQVSSFIALLEPTVNAVIPFVEEQQASQIIQALQKKPISVAGVGYVTYSSKGDPVSGSYYVEKEGVQQLLSLQDTALIDEGTQAFISLLKMLPNGYHGPLVDPYTNKRGVLYTSSLAPVGSQHQTVVFAMQSLDHIQHVLQTLFLGRNGYFFLMDDTQTLVIHPRQIFIKKRTTLDDIAHMTHATSLVHDSIDLSKTALYRNEVTGHESWLVHSSITPVGWTLCGVFETTIASMPNDQERHHLMSIGLLILVVCMLVLLLFVVMLNMARVHQWMLSSLFSLLCLSCIGFLWYVAKKYPTFELGPKQSIIPIENKRELYMFLDSLQKNQEYQEDTTDSLFDQVSDKEAEYYLSYRYRKGKYIPTGVFIHYMQFVSESQVQIVGYVWQRYFDGTHDDMIRGFILPQATTDVAINEVFRKKVGRQETIVWRINATLNQTFSYTRYPFDTREISIQLWHADFSKNSILVPDFDSYPLLTAPSLPGLSTNAYLPNWKFDSSYFGYQRYLYNAMFGLYTYGPFGIYGASDKSYIPELHFVARTQRLLVDTLIDDLLPLFLVALLLFVIFITDMGHGYEVFGAYASVFFGIVVSQLHFRSKIPSNQLVYFETMYVVMYLALIVTVMFTVIKLRSVDEHSLEFKKGKLAELFYWPVLLCSLILLTFVYLY